MTKQILPLENPDQMQARRVSMILRVLLIGMLFLIVASLILVTVLGLWSEIQVEGYILFAFVYPAFPAVGLWLNRRRQSLAALWLALGGLALVMCAVELGISGFGIAFGSAILLFSLFVTLQVRLQAWRAGYFVLGGILLGLALLMLDWFGSPARPAEESQFVTLVTAGLGLMALALALFALRQWTFWTLATKLNIGFIAVSLASVVAVSAISNLVVSGSLSNQVGSSLNALAVNKAELIAGTVDREVDLVIQLASSDLLRQAVVSINSVYPTDPAALDAQIRELNRQWKRSKPGDPAIQLVLSNPSSAQLLRFRDSFPENRQILLTDKLGNLVGATNAPESFYQGDQEWWVKAYAAGKGAMFVTQPVYITDLNQVGIVFAAPIHDPTTSEVVGVVQAVYSLEPLKNQLALSQIGATGASELVFPSGQILHPNGIFEFSNEPDSQALLSLTGVNYANIVYGGNPVLASQAAVQANVASDPMRAGQVNWTVVVHQSPAEALQPVTQATQAALLTGIGSLLLASLLALVAAYFFTRPITRLTGVAEKVAEGDLTARATIDSEDEIGILATTFNRMTGRLRQTLETLEQRVADRTAELTRAGEELEHRASNLETSAEIARAAASTLNLDELLPLVTRLIGERFGFSHVAVYLLDPTRTDAILRTSYSALGQARLEPGEKVPVGSNTFVGSVTAKGERRLAQEVSWDSLYPKSPRLVGTRSELTLPLIEGGQTVGALDVHRAQVGGFIASDVTALTSLADQISIAIQNARSYERQVALAEENRRSVEVQTALAKENKQSAERAEALAEENRLAAERQAALAEQARQSAQRAEALAEENRLAAERQKALADENQRLLERAQQAVQELNAVTQRLTGEGWDQYLETLTAEILVQNAAPEAADAQPALDPLDRARNAGEVITATNGHSTVALPILLRGEVIGSMALEDSDPERKWNEDEIALAQEVSERLALALDNARLYSESQRELAERKRAEAQIRRQNAYLNTLADITVGLIQRLDSQALVETILERASELAETKNGYVYLLDRTTNAMVMSLGIGTYSRLVGQKTTLGRGLAGTVWQTGEPIVLDDYRTWPQRLQTAGREELVAVLGIPLKSGDQVIGVLGLAHTEEGLKFDPTEVDVLQRLSQLASIALDNAQLYAAAQNELEERKRTEQALTAERNLVNMLMDNIPDVIYFKDRQSRFIRVNRAYANRFGSGDTNSFIGKSDFDIFTEEHARPAYEDEQRIIQTGEMVQAKEEKETLSDGRANWVSTTKLPLRNPEGEIIGTAGITRDITERKLAEEQIEQERNLLKTLINTVPDPIWIKDRESRFLIANVATAIQNGVGDPDKIIGKTDSDIFGPEIGSRYRADELAIIESGQPYLNYEEPIWRDGEQRWVISAKSPVRDLQGRVIGLVGVNHDVTDQKRSQEQTRRQNAYLSALADTTVGLIQRLDSQALVETILQRASELTGTQDGYVYLLDRRTNEMEMRIGIGTYSRLIGQKTTLGRGLAGTIWQTGEPLVLDDYRTWPHRLQVAGREDLRAVVGMPLKSGNQTIGVLGLAHLEEGLKFDTAEVDVLTRLSQLASIALDNATLFQQTETNLMWQEALYRASQKIGAATTVAEIASGAGELLPLLEMSSASLALIQEEDAEGNPIRSDLHIARLQDGQIVQLPAILDAAIPGMPSDPVYYDQYRITVFPDLDDLSKTYPPDYLRPVGTQKFLLSRGMHGAVTLGLGAHGHKLGYLTFARQTPLDRPPEEYIERLRVVTDEIAKALDNLNLIEGIQRELEERRRTELALTAERNLVNMLMDNVPDAIYFKDRESRFMRVNQACAKRFGYGSPDELVGKSDFDLFTEEHARPAFEDEQRLMQTGEMIRDKEERETPPDGQVNWVLSTKLPLRDVEGKIVGTAGISRDITERKRFEQVLAESEAFYHNLVELLPENLCMKDLEGRFTFVNQRYCEDAKLPREEIIGKTDYDLHPKEMADKYRADDLQIIRTGDMIDTIEVHQTLAGERTFVHTVKSPTRDASGRITGVQIIFWDVTEQMQTQEKLRQQNEYFVAMHDMSLAMIGRHDVNELLTDIVAHAGTLVGTEHGYVYLFDRESDQIEMRVGVGIYNEFVGSFARRGQGLAGTAWKSGEPVTVDDYRNWPGRLPHPSRDKLRAVVGVPLKSGDQTIGVMGLAYLEEGRRFGPNEIDVLTRFAQLAAIALDNAQLFQDSQKRLNELGALNRISQALTSQLDFDTLTYTIGEHIREIFDVQSVYLALYDRAQNRISFPYFLSDGKNLSVDPIAFGEGLTSRIIQTREPLFLNQDMDRHAQQYHARVIGAPAQSFLGVPILIGNEAIGVLSIQSIKRTDNFTEDDLRLLTTISAGVGVALQNARLFKEAQDRAQREFLTREIVARVSRSINQDTILQTTARQLGHALGSSHVVIRLKGTGTGNGNGGSEPRS